MNNLYKFSQSEKATICTKNNCITVLDEKAKIVNTLAVCASILILSALVAKAFRYRIILKGLTLCKVFLFVVECHCELTDNSLILAIKLYKYIQHGSL